MKKMILDIEPTQKKKKGAAWFELDDDLDQPWIEEHQQFLIEEQRTKIIKKFEKENEKLKANKEKTMPDKELKERMSAVKEMEAKFKKENKAGKVIAEGKGATVDKFMKAIEKIDERIIVTETQAQDRDGNKEVALGTSKIVSRSGQPGGWRSMLTGPDNRTTLIRALPSSSPRSLTSRSRSSFPRLCGTSSGGPSSPWRMTTGNSEKDASSSVCSCSG